MWLVRPPYVDGAASSGDQRVGWNGARNSRVCCLEERVRAAEEDSVSLGEARARMKDLTAELASYAAKTE